MQHKSLSQCEFIAFQFHEVKKKMSEHFEELKNKMNRQFKKVNRHFEEWEKKTNRHFKKVNEHFKEMNEQFQKQESKIQNVQIQLENAAAIIKNSCLHQMHQSINLIKVFKCGSDLNSFMWVSHSQVLKHMKSIYTLNQQAKDIFEFSWKKKPNEQSKYSFTAIHCCI